MALLLPLFLLFAPIEHKISQALSDCYIVTLDVRVIIFLTDNLEYRHPNWIEIACRVSMSH